MEAHGFPFVGSKATLSLMWFTCCQNGAVAQVQHCLEKRGMKINARHTEVGSNTLRRPPARR